MSGRESVPVTGNGTAACGGGGPGRGGQPPLITIAIPTFNRAAMLRQAMQSALAQKFADFELVVSDNASSDGTQQVIAGFADERIRVLRQTTNIGLFANVNACIDAARGAYILILSDDDAIPDDALQLYLGLLAEHPDLSMVMGAVEYLDEGQQPARRRYDRPPLSTGCYPGTFLLAEYLRRRLFPEMCAVLFRTDVLRSGGGFARNHHYAGDLATYARFLLGGRCGLVAAPAGLYRIGPHSQTARLTAELRLRDVWSVLQELTEAASELGEQAQREIGRLAARHLALLAIDRAAAVRRGGGNAAGVLRCLWSLRWCFGNGLGAAALAFCSRSAIRAVTPNRIAALVRAAERAGGRAKGESVRLHGFEAGET